jgi:hypothetical protein
VPVPASLTQFDINGAEVTVWLFRVSGPSNDPVFTGHWIETNDALNAALREAAANARGEILEAHDYDLWAPQEDGQVLLLDANETFAGRIVDASTDPLPKRKAQKIAHIRNTKFYVVRFTVDGTTLLCVRRADDSWSTRKTGGQLPVVFADEQLALEPNPTFTLSQHIDFFIAGEDLVILNKRSFEITLRYAEAHVEDFASLQAEPMFMGLFTDLAPLVAYVGTNKLRLRSLSAIRQKAHFQDAVFMNNLRLNYLAAGLNLTFDPQGRIIPTEAQCPDIVRALLNHRLYSLFSQGYFDVQHAVQV